MIQNKILTIKTAHSSILTGKPVCTIYFVCTALWRCRQCIVATIRGNISLFDRYATFGLHNDAVPLSRECFVTKLNPDNYKLPIPGEAKAKAMPGRLYIHTRNNKNK